MTDSQQNPQHDIADTDKDVDVLAKKLDGTNADKAAAIAQFVDGRIATALEPLKADIRRLIDGQRDVKQRAEELPPADKAAVAPQVNDASRQAREVAKDANDIEARQQAGEKVDPQEIQDLDQRAAQARQSSDQAREAVERKAVAAAQAGREHEAQQASRSKQPASALAPSRDADKGDYSLTGLGARVDQLEACAGELQVVSATAFASATSGDDSGSRRRVVVAAGVAALVTFVVYLLILLGSAEWDWSWAIGLPAVVAAIVGLVVWALNREPGPSAESVARADAIVARWSGQDDGSHQDDEGRDHVVPGMRQQPDHGTHAHAGASARA
jgi:hypothetical protein